MNASVVEQAYWDGVWDRQEPAYNEEQIPFRDLFQRYLQPGGTCFEVGCYPGRFLIYLAKQFGYTVSGIDLTPTTASRVPAFLKANGVEPEDVFQGDFFTHPTDRQYDTVCSFGFVEHFPNFEEVIERHIALVKPGGTLVISCPNFRYVQWLLRRIIEPRNLKIHVLRAMNLRAWSRVLSRHAMEPVFSGYERTFGFWADMPRDSHFFRVLANRTGRLCDTLDRKFHWPNRLTSPMMINISRKPMR